ncbi:MAG: hypothetical protein KDB61_00395, partial [Planctomycetes bacterium]|nr:hypothetical protein [Planctomycetota bacterium]
MRYLKNALLVLLAITSLATIGVAAVWNFRPQYVQWFDTKWCNAHRKFVDQEYARLVELSKSDPNSAIASLDSLADSLGG